MAAKAKPKRRKAGNDLIDSRVKGLAHHTRRKIMAHLINVGPDSPSKMAKALGEKLMDINYHARKLEGLGCVELADERAGPGRPAEKVYRATERYLIDLSEWEALDWASKEAMAGEWAQLFVDDLVEGFRAETLGTHEHFALMQNRVIVDEKGREELIEFEKEAMERVNEIQARALGRLSDEDQGLRMSVLHASFEVPSVDNA